MTVSNTGEVEVGNITLSLGLPFPGNSTAANIDLIQPNGSASRLLGVTPAEDTIPRLYVVPVEIGDATGLLHESLLLVNVKGSEPSVTRIEIIEHLLVMGMLKGEKKKAGFLLKNTGNVPVKGVEVRMENSEGCIMAPAPQRIGDLDPGKSKTASFTFDALDTERECNSTVIAESPQAVDIKPVRLVVAEKSWLDDIIKSFNGFMKWLEEQAVQSMAHISKIVSSVTGERAPTET